MSRGFVKEDDQEEAPFILHGLRYPMACPTM
jgi:hypothetical protein